MCIRDSLYPDPPPLSISSKGFPSSHSQHLSCIHRDSMFLPFPWTAFWTSAIRTPHKNSVRCSFFIHSYDMVSPLQPPQSVSYTHLDVYKRQFHYCIISDALSIHLTYFSSQVIIGYNLTYLLYYHKLYCYSSILSWMLVSIIIYFYIFTLIFITI